MKKSILVMTAIFSIAVLFTSCKDNKKEDAKTEKHDTDCKVASADVYQCPMDCEKGKTYEKEGPCPVCKMDLRVKSGDCKEMKHTDGCTCKEGGECTCEDGKCKCKAKTACAKCEPGKCKCKAKTACTKCESGKCTCKASASVEKVCDHCEPGQCTCKGKEVAKAKECTKCESGKCECKA